ncbi:hypothetical protein [Pontibacter burrus]|nr:hypothetical protein [Pontibacter burrus]
MNLILYLLSLVTHRVLNVPQLLGTMLLGRTHPDGSLSRSFSTKLFGNVAHFLVGILYIIGYLALWESGVGTVTASWSLLIGFDNGILAMIIWYFFFMIHPKPPIIQLEKYLITLVFSHIFFGFAATYVYYRLNQPEHSFWQ